MFSFASMLMTVLGCTNPDSSEDNPVTKTNSKVNLVDSESNYNRDIKLAILTCVLCFFPTGIFAVLIARKAKRQAENGDTIQAEVSSRRAKILTYISLYVGLFGMALTLILVLVEYHTSVFTGGK